MAGKLPFDVGRCHDDDCPKHETCLRWLGKDDDGIWVSHYETLRYKDTECKHYIPEDDHAKDD